MVSVKLEMKAEKLSKLIDNLENLDMVALHSDLGEEMRNIIEERFDKGVDPKGKKWKKIKRYFNADHNEWRNPSDTPLKLKDLYSSFSYNAGLQGVVVGTPKVYAKYHTDAPTNNGKPRKKIPLREFMGVESDRDIETLLDVVDTHVKEALNV